MTRLLLEEPQLTSCQPDTTGTEKKNQNKNLAKKEDAQFTQ